MVTIKLTLKGLEAAYEAMSEWEGGYVQAEQAIKAYCEATDTVLVPRAKRDSAVALLMGLSAYWREQGDTTQAEYVESVAKALTQEGEE